MDLYRNLLSKRREWGEKAVNFEMLRPSARSSTSDKKHPLYPVWYFSPIRGIPRGAVKVPETRMFAKSGWAQTVMAAIKRAVLATKWDVVVDEEFEDETQYRESVDYIKAFLQNPNRELQQDFNHLVETLLTDILEIDAGVWFLNGGLDEPLVEIVPYDGSTFLKEQDEHGFLKQYWQFSYKHPIADPIPFEPHQVAYFQMTKRSYDPYGYSPLQAIEQVIELMDQATRYNKDFFLNNAVPQVLVNLPGTNPESLKKFKDDWNHALQGWNSSIAVHSAMDMKVERLAMTNREMEWLNGQKWYMHLVFAAFGVSPSEVGFTDTTGSKSVQEGQERVTIRNAHIPYLNKIENMINRLILPRILGEGALKPNERTPIMFKYMPMDNEMKAVEEEAQRKDIAAQIITINEARQARGLEPFPDERADDPFFNSFQAAMPDAFGDEAPPTQPLKPGKKEEQQPQKQKRETVATVLNTTGVVKTPVVVESAPYESFFNKMIEGWKAEINRAVRTQLYKEYAGSAQYERRMNAKLLKGFNDFLRGLVSNTAMISFHNALTRAVKQTLDKGVQQAEAELDLNVSFDLDQKASSVVNQQLDGYTLPDGTKWVGLKGVSRQVQTAVYNKVRDGLSLRKSTESIVDDVTQLIDGISRSRGAAIVRTESNRMVNMGKIAAYKEAGVEGKKQVVAFIDDRTSPICRYMKGQTRGLLEPFTGPNGESYEQPPFHVNCRSFVRFVQGDDTKKGYEHDGVLEKYKYRRRWRGRDGKWQYDYGDGKPRDRHRNIVSDKTPAELAIIAEQYQREVKPKDAAKVKHNIKEWKAGRDTKGLHSKDGVYTPDRQVIHKRIIRHYNKSAKYAINKEKKVLFMSGLPASGKTYSVKNYLTKESSIVFSDKQGNKYINLNADDIKEMLPEYDNGLGAITTHEESSDILNELISSYRAQGVSVIIDGTMKTLSGAREKLAAFKGANYDSRLIFVDVKPEVALSRAKARYEKTGRLVPYEFIASIHPKILNTVAVLKDSFDSFVHIDNNQVTPKVIS